MSRKTPSTQSHVLVGKILLLSFLMAVRPLLFAQEKEATQDLTTLSIEDLMNIEVASVYGASKFLQKVTEAPASISIVTAEEISRYGYRTLGELLGSVRGMYVNNDRNYVYLGIRGFARPGDYNTRILLLVDGHRLNDNVYDMALLGTEFQLDLDLIDKVEIIRGPSSSLYGTNAFFGVANVITKQGLRLDGLQTSARGGSLNTYAGRLSFGDTLLNGLDIILSGTYYDSKGNHQLYFEEYDDPSTNNGIAQGVDMDRSKQLFSTFSWRGFTLQGVYSTRKKIVPTGAFETIFNDPRTYTIDERSYVDLKYEGSFNAHYTVNARTFYDEYGYFGDYISQAYVDTISHTVVNRDGVWGHWLGAEVNFTTNVIEYHKLTIGSEMRKNTRQDQLNYDTDPFVVYTDSKQSSLNWALFLQDEFSISEHLLLNVGIRYDHYESFGGTTNPRAGLVYSPTKETAIKFLYGRAFRAPNAYELYYSSLGYQKGNLDLRPEHIRTGEVVYEQYIGKHLRASVSGFYYLIDNLITQQTDPIDGVLVYRNVERIESRGVECELEAKLPAGLEGIVSYAFQRTKNMQDDLLLTNSPQHLMKMKASAPVWRDNVFLAAQLQYTSKRKTLGGQWADGFSLSSLALSTRSLVHGLDISVGIYNLFDVTYGDPGAEEHRQDVIVQDRRTFGAKVSYTF
jgi:outer membrane receptor for ferrienterochelin and colicins